MLVHFILFILISIISFTLPGILVLSLSTHKFTLYEKVFIGTSIGFVLFTLVAYFLILLHLPILAPVFTLITLFYYLLKYKNKRFKIPKPTKVSIPILIIFALGIAGQMAVIAPSGIVLSGDLVFWSAHGHDGPWHLALMEELIKGPPFQNPVFAGERLVNYHFFSDIAPAIFANFLPFSSLDLYFRFFPLIFSVLLGTSAYFLVKHLTNKIQPAIWATIFTYFGGSFGYIVTYIKSGEIRGESIFWATQIQSSSGNPPQIISNFMVLNLLLFIFLFIKKRDNALIFASILFLGTLAVFKIYAAVVMFAALSLPTAWQIVKHKRKDLFLMAAASSAIAAALYLPNTASSTSFLIFQPWWYIRTMIVEPSRLNWIDHELRRQTYISESNLKRVIYLETMAFVIFFAGNLGTRLIGIIELVKSSKTILSNYFNAILILIIFFSILFPLLFLQKGVASNTSQSLQYFILVFGLLAGISTAQILSKFKSSIVKTALVAIIIITTVPTQVGLLDEFYSRRSPFTKVSSSEIEALNFLEENTGVSSTILTPPYDPFFNLDDGNIPNIWDWSDTGYVAALSKRRTYFTDKEQVDIMGYEFKQRESIKSIIFETDNVEIATENIKKTNASHIYFPKPRSPVIDLAQTGASLIYQNQEVEVWKTTNDI